MGFVKGFSTEVGTGGGSLHISRGAGDGFKVLLDLMHDVYDVHFLCREGNKSQSQAALELAAGDEMLQAAQH